MTATETGVDAQVPPGVLKPGLPATVRIEGAPLAAEKRP